MASAMSPSAAAANMVDAAVHNESIEAVASTLDAVTIRPAPESSATPQAAPEEAQVKPVRGTTVKMSVPLDDSTPSTSTRQTATVHGTRKLLRRDSLDRREAVLKGKEGSRQRRRWENDRLLNNPHAEPPLPSDWEVRPTYPRRTIPYYLAPLWDAAEFQRAIEAKLKSRRGSTRTRRHGKKSSRSDGATNVYEAGMSPMEEAAANIPKEIRARLKHARSAKGLLMDLEEDVRGFVRRWNERELRMREDGLGDAPLPPRSKESLALRPKKAEVVAKKHKDSAIESDEEDDEIVFVGRNGTMHDMPSSPARSITSVVDADNDHHMVDSNDDKQEPGELETTRNKDDGIIATEKCIFQSASSDASAGFARWLVHCVGSYYGLRTWSVTRMVEGESRREAYVGVDSRARGMMGIGSGRCVVETSGRRGVELPMPLYGMV